VDCAEEGTRTPIPYQVLVLETSVYTISPPRHIKIPRRQADNLAIISCRLGFLKLGTAANLRLSSCRFDTRLSNIELKQYNLLFHFEQNFGEPGIFHYMNSTRCGYFSSFHSKRYLATASIPSAPEYRKIRLQESDFSVFVGEPGIEPGPHGPKPRTLPLCYTPM
jgi:hypothetical protein